MIRWLERGRADSREERAKDRQELAWVVLFGCKNQSALLY
jgi:hypothetical protein